METEEMFAERVRYVAAHDLPYDLAQAVWLVDVCGCRYDEAAAEIGVQEHNVARSVSRGRRAIRAKVESAGGRANAVADSSSKTTGRHSFRRFGVVVSLAVAPLLVTSACGGDDADEQVEIGHIHDLVELGDDLLVATHQGLLRLDGDSLQRVGTEVHDFMSLATLPGGDLVASGHPDMRMEKYRVEGAPSFLGLIRSGDGGESWEIVDLLGQVDFHALAQSADRLYGGASSGMIWEFPAGSSAGHPLGGVEQALRDLASSPDTPGTLVTTSFDGEVGLTRDGAQTWEFLVDSPALVEVEYVEGLVTGIDTDGGVWTADDPQGPYQQIGEAPDEVDALLVDSRGELWIGTHDGSIWRSPDGDEWSLVRDGSS